LILTFIQQRSATLSSTHTDYSRLYYSTRTTTILSLSPVHTSNNVEATFDFVERTKFYDELVRHCYRCWQHSRMLLRQSRTLLRHCCWCGRGFRQQRPNAFIHDY